MLRRPLFTAVALVLLSLLSACSIQKSQTTHTASVSSTASFSASEKKISSANSGQIKNTLPSTVNLTNMANTYASTPGRVALSLIICSMDRSNSLKTLPQKSARDLFSMLRETAAQNTQTLESLNTEFGLTDILASEGIYVRIHANAADTLTMPTAPAADWITRFESAYATSSSNSKSS